MKKNLRMMLSMLLVLVFVFQFAGGMAWADDVNVTLSGKEALVYELRLADAEGKSSPLSAEEETEKLGASCTVAHLREGSEEADAPLSRTAGSSVLEDLVNKGLIVKAPEGFYVSEAYLQGDAVETQTRKALPFTAQRESTELVMKVGAIGDKDKHFDKRFLTTASTVDPQVYTLVLVLSPVEKEKTLTVTVANDSNAPGSEQQVNPGESFTAPEAPVPNTEDLRFACWQVKYPSGGTLKLNPGESFKPYANCRVEGSWIDVITVTANAPVEEGESFAPNGFSFRGHLADGDAISSVSLGIQEQEDGFVAVPSEAVIMNGEENVTDRYELRYVNSDPVQKEDSGDDPTPAPDPDPEPVPVEPVKITVTAQEPVSNDGGKTYEQNGAVLSSGALNEGDAFAGVIVEVQQREDGSFVAVPRDAVIKNGETDVTANYDITYEASQPVTPPAPEKVKLTVTAKEPVSNDGGKTYEQNGAVLSSGALNEGDAFAGVIVEVQQREDGSFVAVPRDAVIKNGETDVTANYDITYEASQPVTPPAPEKVKLTVTAKEPVSNDGGKTYEQNGAVLSSGALNEGDAFVGIVVEVKQNEDGSYVAIPRDAVIKNGDTDNTANYEISYEASQPVTPPAPEKVKLTVTAREPVTKDNGKTYEQDGALLSSGALNEGDAFVGITIDVKQNEDGSYVAVPRDGIIKNGDTDVTANYEITYVASQPVKPSADKIAITLRSKDRTAEYSGKPITAEEYEIVSGALAEGDTIEVKFEGGSTNVTASPVPSTIASVVIKDALGNDVTESKYAVTLDNVSAGKVTVTKHPITVTAITGTVETDGTKVIYAKDCKTANGSFTKGHKVEGLLPGHELRGDFVKGYGSETFVTSIDLTQLRVVDTANGDTDVTANYQVNTVDGKMTIKVSAKTGVPVAVTLKDQSWTYDGAAHRPDQSGYNISGLLDGDVATVTLQLKQNETQMEEATNAGTYSIVPVVSIKDKDGNAVSESKYKINASNATLTVKKLDITLEAVSDTKPYDGKALVNDKVKAPALAAGHKYQGVKLNVYDAKGNLIKNGAKEVGTYTKKITEVHIVDAKGVEVTDNYNITKVDGKLVITNSSKNDSKSPKTGDDSKPVLYIILIIASLVLLGVIVVFLAMQNRRKKMLQPEPELAGEYFEPDEIGNDWQDIREPVEEEPMTPPESWNPDEAWKDLGKELDEVSDEVPEDVPGELPDEVPDEGIDPLPEEPVHKPKH